jgi:hypothetical protein
MKTAVELLTTGNSVRFPSGAMTGYDSTKHNFGSIFYQGTDSWTGSENFIGPTPIQVVRPMESVAPNACGLPHAIQIGKYEWAVLLTSTPAATTIKFLLYIYRADLGTFTYRGSITNATAFATAFTVKGVRLQRTVTTTGTVTVSGTAVTGTGTDWFTKRINAGARIGFGSTDPDQITTWYEIAPGAALTANASLTLSASGPTLGTATPYIIEDYSIIFSGTAATAADGGGLRIIKGLNLNTSCFSPTATPTAIATATTIDNIRAMYWLKNAAVATLNLASSGFALDDVSTDNLTQNAYVLDGNATTATIYVYNIKKAMTLTTGYDTTGVTITTGGQAVTGSLATMTHNCRIGTLKHGVGNGVKCLYFTTLTRVHRCALTNITAASVAFISDSMTEVPPGSINTIPATATMSNIEIFDSIDRIAWLSSCASAYKSYVTQYRTDSSQLDHIWLGDTKVQHQSASDATAYPYPSTDSTVMSTWGEGGMCFIVRHGATAALNQVYAIPVGAHWGYQGATTGSYQMYITPAIATPGCSKYWRLCVNEATQLGGDNLGVTPEGYRVYYRTTGIVDNSGAWQALPLDLDLSGISAATSIQFKFEFKIFSITCVPARIFGAYVIYESQDDIPSDLRWNMDDSSSTDGTIGFIQATSFAALPTIMQVDYYRVDNSSNVLSQLSSGTTNGVFEYWTGSAWSAGLGTNTIGLRRRFRPTAGLPNAVAVYPKLTVVA